MQPMDIVLKFQLDKRTVKTPGGVTTSMHGILILKNYITIPVTESAIPQYCKWSKYQHEKNI